LHIKNKKNFFEVKILAPAKYYHPVGGGDYHSRESGNLPSVIQN
jgi:hypothetical protein